MPLSESQVKAEQAGPRRRNVSVGDSLSILIQNGCPMAKSLCVFSVSDIPVDAVLILKKIAQRY